MKRLGKAWSWKPTGHGAKARKGLARKQERRLLKADVQRQREEGVNDA